MSSTTASSPPSDRSFFIFNAVLSTLAISGLAWLLLAHRGVEGGPDLRFMPGVNAMLNGSAALLLIAGRIAVARRKLELHRYLMVSAFVCSALFLIGYVAYHAVHGDTKFGGTGAIRTVYLLILASHVILSIGIVPMCLAAFWFAWKKEFTRHTRVTRWLHPIWLYVSVTGVVVFLMLRPYY
jgi:putative membrane protein